MAQVRLFQTGMHVSWKTGENITVQVGEELGDGEYLCETLETYPPDLKDQHAAELAARDANYRAGMATLRESHAAEIERLSAPPPPTPGPPQNEGTSAQHQRDLEEFRAKAAQ